MKREPGTKPRPQLVGQRDSLQEGDRRLCWGPSAWTPGPSRHLFICSGGFGLTVALKWLFYVTSDLSLSRAVATSLSQSGLSRVPQNCPSQPASPPGPAPACSPLARGRALVLRWLPGPLALRPPAPPLAPAQSYTRDPQPHAASRVATDLPVSPSPRCPARSVPAFPSRTHLSPRGPLLAVLGPDSLLGSPPS